MRFLIVLIGVSCMVLAVSISAASNAASTKLPNEPAELVSQPPAPKFATDDDPFAPIDNMHHFMEYISQPSYKALKAAFAGDPPEGRRAWKGIKSHALILAETTAIVAKRTPKDATDEQKSEWKEISVEVYAAGKALYKSAGDFELAKKNYGVMIESCNKCHQVFDHGKHQLEK